MYFKIEIASERVIFRPGIVVAPTAEFNLTKSIKVQHNYFYMTPLQDVDRLCKAFIEIGSDGCELFRGLLHHQYHHFRHYPILK